MRLWPRARWVRRLTWLGILLGYFAVMWYFVFPWLTRITNSPTVGG